MLAYGAVGVPLPVVLLPGGDELTNTPYVGETMQLSPVVLGGSLFR